MFLENKIEHQELLVAWTLDKYKTFLCVEIAIREANNNYGLYFFLHLRPPGCEEAPMALMLDVEFSPV